MYTKTKLMQKKITVKIPSYKWVVEDLCSQCDAECVSAEIKPGTKIPPPPPDIRIKASPPGPPPAPPALEKKADAGPDGPELK